MTSTTVLSAPAIAIHADEACHPGYRFAVVGVWLPGTPEGDDPDVGVSVNESTELIGWAPSSDDDVTVTVAWLDGRLVGRYSGSPWYGDDVWELALDAAVAAVAAVAP